MYPLGRSGETTVISKMRLSGLCNDCFNTTSGLQLLGLRKGKEICFFYSFSRYEADGFGCTRVTFEQFV